MASDLLLKPAERLRLSKVKAMLAEGSSPYAHITNGGAAPNIEELKRSRPLVTPEKDYTGLESKWSAAHEPLPKPKYELDIDFGDTEEPPRDPLKLYCSFCGVEVQERQATRGKFPKVYVKRELVDHGNGIKTIEEEVQFRSKKAVACPDCSLQIKPTVHRDGSISNNVSFPETEG